MSSKSDKTKDKKEKKQPKKKVEGAAVSALADRVQSNTLDIQGLKETQDRVEKKVDAFKLGTDEKLDSILAKLDGQGAVPKQQTQFQKTTQGYSGAQGYSLGQGGTTFNKFGQNNQAKNNQQSKSWNWKGFQGQRKQSNSGFNRATPTAFPKGNAAAALAEEEAEDDDTEITMNVSQFFQLTQEAGYADEDVVASLQAQKDF